MCEANSFTVMIDFVDGRRCVNIAPRLSDLCLEQLGACGTGIHCVSVAGADLASVSGVRACRHDARQPIAVTCASLTLSDVISRFNTIPRHVLFVPQQQQQQQQHATIRLISTLRSFVHSRLIGIELLDWSA